MGLTTSDGGDWAVRTGWSWDRLQHHELTRVTVVKGKKDKRNQSTRLSSRVATKHLGYISVWLDLVTRFIIIVIYIQFIVAIIPLVEEHIDSLKLDLTPSCMFASVLQVWRQTFKKICIDFEKKGLCVASEEQHCLSASLHLLQGFALLLFWNSVLAELIAKCTVGKKLHSMQILENINCGFWGGSKGAFCFFKEAMFL